VAIAITGASGLIGTALAQSLTDDGIDVIRLVRRPAAGPGEVSWDPARRTVDTQALAEQSITAVVHLAGAGVGDRRWNTSYKNLILSSRVDGTAAIAAAVAELPGKPVLVSGSAIGYYGDTGSDIVDESGPEGDTFLAHVVQEWEAATAPAQQAGNDPHWTGGEQHRWRIRQNDSDLPQRHRWPDRIRQTMVVLHLDG